MLVQLAMTLGWTTGKQTAVKPLVDVLPQIATNLAEVIWSVHMCRKFMVLTIGGTLCPYVEVVTLAPMSFMLTRPWYQCQAISNIIDLGCASRICSLGLFYIIRSLTFNSVICFITDYTFNYFDKL